MQITETLAEGLHREFKILVDAKDLDAKLVNRLTEMAPNVQLKGFRPGKAPVSYLKKAYGKSLMGEIVQAVVNETSEEAIKKHELKPAVSPRIDFTNEIENVIAGRADLEFTMKVDLMPEFELANLSEIKVERLVADVTDIEVEEGLQRLADLQRTFAPRPEGEAAEKGDSLNINFTGSVGGVPFEGGSAENFDLVLGSNRLLKDFEDRLVGAKAGENLTITLTFPDNYGAPEMAGKTADFAVMVNEVKAPQPSVMDEEMARRMGVDSLETLKQRVREQAKIRFAQASRTHLKRRLLDALDAAHSFELPPAMMKFEFDTIWRQVMTELKRENKTPEDEGTTEAQLRADYNSIAERRVRLGLVLSKTGEQNGIVVTEDELSQAVLAQARQFPGQEPKIFEYYQRNPQTLAELRAPIFEDKVIDFVAELAQITDRKVDRETLFMDPDDAAETLKAESSAPEAKPEKAEAKDEKPKGKKK